MKRLSITLSIAAAILAFAPQLASAQDDDDDIVIDEGDPPDGGDGDGLESVGDDDDDGGDGDGDGDGLESVGDGDGDGDGGTGLEGLDLGGTKPKKGDRTLGEERISWSDIVVVVRKPFLKVKRLELLPTWGVTMNDNIIQHVQLSGQLNYFLTDVLAVGLEGNYYVDRNREPFDLVARQARRLPTVNKYKYGASLNFHYVPVYGKFAVLNEYLIHWETFFTAGVGFTQSETKVRDPRFQPFSNFLITPNVGASMRFFLTKFITVNVGIRDYIFVDKFEAVDRTEVSGAQAKNNADSALINNVLFQAGLSFWIPPTFEYTTFR